MRPDPTEEDAAIALKQLNQANLSMFYSEMSPRSPQLKNRRGSPRKHINTIEKISPNNERKLRERKDGEEDTTQPHITCDVCQGSFSKMYNLNRHKQSKHPGSKIVKKQRSTLDVEAKKLHHQAAQRKYQEKKKNEMKAIRKKAEIRKEKIRALKEQNQALKKQLSTLRSKQSFSEFDYSFY
jgi:vacuolar-type H+-ATPase subunit I/STV1